MIVGKKVKHEKIQAAPVTKLADPNSLSQNSIKHSFFFEVARCNLLKPQLLLNVHCQRYANTLVLLRRRRSLLIDWRCIDGQKRLNLTFFLFFFGVCVFDCRAVDCSTSYYFALRRFFRVFLCRFFFSLPFYCYLNLFEQNCFVYVVFVVFLTFIKGLN